MKSARLKYPTKIADKLYPVGTIIELFNANAVQQEWPGIKTNRNSTQIATRFPDSKNITILNIKSRQQSYFVVIYFI
jgi:hypothetical protein